MTEWKDRVLDGELKNVIRSQLKVYDSVETVKQDIPQKIHEDTDQINNIALRLQQKLDLKAQKLNELKEYYNQK